VDLHYSLMLVFGMYCVGSVGVLEAGASASVETTLKYHPVHIGNLTWARDPGRGQRQAGSLTGAVAS
jgi:hypothetical protein